MNIKNLTRFQVHDEEGYLRGFATKEEANKFIGDREDLVLVVKQREVVDVFKLVGDAPF
jgi:hypothetical protein